MKYIDNVLQNVLFSITETTNKAEMKLSNQACILVHTQQYTYCAQSVLEVVPHKHTQVH